MIDALGIIIAGLAGSAGLVVVRQNHL